MPEEHGQPCEGLRELEKQVNDHAFMFKDTATHFAVINTKLSGLIAGLVLFAAAFLAAFFSVIVPSMMRG